MKVVVFRTSSMLPHNCVLEARRHEMAIPLSWLEREQNCRHLLC